MTLAISNMAHEREASTDAVFLSCLMFVSFVLDTAEDNTPYKTRVNQILNEYL